MLVVWPAAASKGILALFRCCQPLLRHEVWEAAAAQVAPRRSCTTAERDAATGKGAAEAAQTAAAATTQHTEAATAGTAAGGAARAQDASDKAVAEATPATAAATAAASSAIAAAGTMPKPKQEAQARHQNSCRVVELLAV